MKGHVGEGGRAEAGREEVAPPLQERTAPQHNSDREPLTCPFHWDTPWGEREFVVLQLRDVSSPTRFARMASHFHCYCLEDS